MLLDCETCRTLAQKLRPSSVLRRCPLAKLLPPFHNLISPRRIPQPRLACFPNCVADLRSFTNRILPTAPVTLWIPLRLHQKWILGGFLHRQTFPLHHNLLFSLIMVSVHQLLSPHLLTQKTYPSWSKLYMAFEMPLPQLRPILKPDKFYRAKGNAWLLLWHVVYVDKIV